MTPPSITICMLLCCAVAGARVSNAGGSGRGETALDRRSSVPVTGPLKIHPINHRYFADGHGKAIYLTGSHTWNSVQDIRGYEIRSLPGGFDGYLRWLQSYNHNFIRLWVLEHAWDAERDAVIEPNPWLRTGPGEALDHRPKFDLTRFDAAYFNRLRQRVAAAAERGFYVSVMLFDSWSTHHRETWKGHPFHGSNNINNINGDPRDTGLGSTFHSLESSDITRLQIAYVKKVLDTVNDFDNVLYEIANEEGASRDWQYFMVKLIQQYEIGKPKRHPVGMTVGFPPAEVDNSSLFKSHADWISPNSDGGYKDNPPAADGRKVILSDTDHLWGVGGDRTWVWKSFLRGLNPIYMDRLDSDSVSEDARRAMGYTRDYANRFDLAAMLPRNDLASSRYCLAQPGAQYLIYLPLDPHPTENWVSSIKFIRRFAPQYSSLTKWLRGFFRRAVKVNLSAAAGQFTAEWFNPGTGETVPGGKAMGGSTQKFTAPFYGDAVLYLTAEPLRR